MTQPRDLVHISSSAYTATSLNLPDDLTFEDWENVGAAVTRMAESSMWWLGDWWRYGEHRYGERAAQAPDGKFQTWMDAGWVAGKVETSRRREVLSWNHHKEVAALEPDEQNHWLDKAEAESMTRNELRSAIRRGRVATAKPVSLPAGKYNVIYSDPPWQYDFVEADNRAIENQYPTMTADAIACFEDADQRPVADLAADDAVLFLWATNPKLTEALVVMSGWGFQYVTNAVWVKDRIGMGYWFRQRHELLLVGKRGTYPPPATDARFDSVIEAPRTAHSAKPPSVYEHLEAMTPGAERIEVFARAERPGWASFGNQL